MRTWPVLVVLAAPLGTTAAFGQCASLSYSVSGGNGLLLEQPNGTLDLMAWNEGGGSSTVNLGQTFGTVEVFDPAQGSAPILTLNNVSSVQPPPSASPYVIQVSNPTSAAPAGGTQAQSALAFDNSIGVNTHLGYPGVYGNAGLALQELEYLGVNKVRDQAGNVPGYVTLAKAGVKFDLITSPRGADLNQTLAPDLANVADLAQAVPGSVLTVEGPNELNGGQYVLLNGASSQDPATGAAIVQYVSQAVRSNPILSSQGVGVVNVSINNGGAGWQDYIAGLGNLSSAVNYGNFHVYFNGQEPAQAFASMIPDALESAPGRPVEITETGYSTEAGGAVSQQAQASMTLNALADAFKDGSSTTFLYELNDGNTGSSDSEDNYGLFTSSGAPKPVATAIHNLTTILGGTVAAATAPGAQCGGAVATTHLSLPPAAVVQAQQQQTAFQVPDPEPIPANLLAPEPQPVLPVVPVPPINTNYGLPAINPGLPAINPSLPVINTVLPPISQTIPQFTPALPNLALANFPDKNPVLAPVAGPVKAVLGMINPIGTWLTRMDGSILTAGDAALQGIAPMLTVPVGVAALLFLGARGVRVAQGDAGAFNAVWFDLVKISIVIGLSLNLGNYDYYVRNFFYTTIPDAMAGAVAAGAGVSVANGVQSVASTIDGVWAQSWDWVGKAWQDAGITDVGTVIAAFLCGAMIALSLVCMALVYLLARLLLSIVLVFGPICIACSMNRSTAPIFERWMGKVIALVFLQVAGVVVLVMIFSANKFFMEQITPLMKDAGGTGMALPWGGVNPSPVPKTANDVQVLFSMAVWIGMGAFALYSLPAIAYSIGTGVAVSFAPVVLGLMGAGIAIGDGASALLGSLSGISWGGGESLSMGMEMAREELEGMATSSSLPPPPPPALASTAP